MRPKQMILSIAAMLALSSCGLSSNPFGSDDSPFAPASEQNSAQEHSSPEEYSSAYSTPEPYSSEASPHENIEHHYYEQVGYMYDSWADGVLEDQQLITSFDANGYQYDVIYYDNTGGYVEIEGDTLSILPDGGDQRFDGGIIAEICYRGATVGKFGHCITIGGCGYFFPEALYGTEIGTTVIVLGEVTATYGDYFYLQEGSRAVKVLRQGHACGVGTRVAAYGSLIEADGTLLFEARSVREAYSHATMRAVDWIDPLNGTWFASSEAQSRAFRASNVLVESIAADDGVVHGSLVLADGSSLPFAFEAALVDEDILNGWGYRDGALDGSVAAGSRISIEGVLDLNAGTYALHFVRMMGLDALAAITIAEAVGYADGTYVCVKGVITATYGDHFFIGDGRRGTEVIGPLALEDLPIGTTVAVEGKVRRNGLQYWIDDVQSVYAIAETIEAAPFCGTESLTHYNQGRKAVLTGISYTSYTQNGDGLTFTSSGLNEYEIEFEAAIVGEDMLREFFGWSPTEGETTAVSFEQPQYLAIEGVTYYVNERGFIRGTGASHALPEPEAISASVKEAQEGAAGVPYIVSGYIDDMASGERSSSCSLYDATDCAFVSLYHLSADSGFITWNGYCYDVANTNTKQTLLGEDGQYFVRNGTYVTVKLVWTDKNGYLSNNAVLLEWSNDIADFTASKAVVEGEGTVEFSQSEGLAYGQEVTVAATPKEGYVLSDLIRIDHKGNRKHIINSMSFTVSIYNRIEAYFVPEGTALSSYLTLDTFAKEGALSEDGSSISWSEGDATFAVNKVSGSTAIRTVDADHFRIYVGYAASIKVAVGTIEEVVLRATDARYAAVFPQGGLGVASTSVEGTTITIKAQEGVNEILIPPATKQYRISSIDVTYDPSGVAVARENRELTFLSTEEVSSKIDGTAVSIAIDNSALGATEENAASLLSSVSVKMNVTAHEGSEYADYASGGAKAIGMKKAFSFSSVSAEALVLAINLMSAPPEGSGLTFEFQIVIYAADAIYSGSISLSA
ncbi:MAG: hypothetical protein K6F32_06150 [Bacilli bacterium]|nr:hypothetical protein [Bacilli bacterium]